jgi:hypothetical protein
MSVAHAGADVDATSSPATFTSDEHESEQGFQYLKRYRARLIVILKSGQVEEVAVIDT